MRWSGVVSRHFEENPRMGSHETTMTICSSVECPTNTGNRTTIINKSSKLRYCTAVRVLQRKEERDTSATLMAAILLMHSALL